MAGVLLQFGNMTPSYLSDPSGDGTTVKHAMDFNSEAVHEEWRIGPVPNNRRCSCEGRDGSHPPSPGLGEGIPKGRIDDGIG
jgi:hypothetical protein